MKSLSLEFCECIRNFVLSLDAYVEALVLSLEFCEFFRNFVKSHIVFFAVALHLKKIVSDAPNLPLSFSLLSIFY